MVEFGGRLVYLCNVWWKTGESVAIMKFLFIWFLVAGRYVWCLGVCCCICSGILEKFVESILFGTILMYQWCLVVCWYICLLSGGSLVYMCGVWLKADVSESGTVWWKVAVSVMSCRSFVYLKWCLVFISGF